MLKALELVGFKSFADRTRFEFPPGITVVVGPNGSGKSNIVDGIKWVLGEQSAKGLRGKDMADVIFKGGGSGGRKPASMAEATIVLDNVDRRFEFDADEVRVTRRVYRDGEGEYLINGEPCRLKDIRHLFRGTGAGTDAYSLIEQGKVDRMLQASPKDRRAIFEEAAGISRFKVKKIETQRRLARVEQNFLRLSDIVEEVENRLRTVRAQASKAVRYKECTERLQELRTFVGMVDWRRMTSREEQLVSDRQSFEQTLQSANEQVASGETVFQEAESRLSEIVEVAADAESRLAAVRGRISEQESLKKLQKARSEELEHQIGPLHRQYLSQRKRDVELAKQLQEHEQVLIGAELEYRSACDQVEATRALLDSLQQQAAQLHESIDEHRQALVSEKTILGQEERRRDLLLQESRQLAQQLEQLESRLQRWELDRQSLESERIAAESRQRSLEIEMDSRSTALAAASAELERAQRRRDERQELAATLRNQHHGLEQRAAVIEELEQKQEGITAGVKQVLRASHQHDGSEFRGVVGMVADLIQVQVQQAELVDTALGEMAQAVVVEGDDLLQAIAAGTTTLEGRVVLLRTGKYRPMAAIRSDLAGVEGVVGRADQMVQTAAGYRDLATQLLGGTWIVKSLEQALRLRLDRASDVCYLTLDGQIVDVDGTISVGPRGRGLGIVSRRSELRALKRDLEELEERQDLVQGELIELREQIELKQSEVTHLRSEQQELTKGLSEQKLILQAVAQKLDRVQLDLKDGKQDAQEKHERKSNVDSDHDRASTQIVQLQAHVDELEATVKSAEKELRGVEKQVTQTAKGLTEAEVMRAKAEQRLSHEEGRAATLKQEQSERLQVLDELLSQRRRAETALSESQLGQLAATTELGIAYWDHQQIAQQVRQLQLERAEVTTRRKVSLESLEKSRDSQRRLQGELHKLELELGQLQLEKSKLAERLSDDYGIDISQIEVDQPTGGEADRSEIESEIETLRRKINSIGAVNLDALEELNELEARFQLLDTQYRDLVDSKQQLEKIIERINADSRRLFAETLEAIRANFQILYRRSFGGGKADLVVEADADILEAGIDIVATPPGKPEFSNSLLSGGEKALTAVALLMAIFQHRPSPFCVLDEVDAPFDEANIGRFVDVLKGFLDTTKFIIVTHSKKTMTAANTLYGVTMQESGISRRVSVRFEDVSDDGHISDEAIERSEQESDDELVA